MPDIDFPTWWQGVTPSTTVETTLTRVAQMTETMYNVNAPQNPPLLHKFEGKSIASWISHSIHFCLLVSIPILLWLVYRQRAKISEGEDEDLTEEDRQRAWKTKDWMALYGLITMAHDNDWQHSPFRDKFNRSIRERRNKPNRVGLRRLLHKGIIPLFVQDGGVGTQQLGWWGWSDKFPYLKLPLFRQSKNRAYLEFLVPYPHKGNNPLFLDRLVRNKQRYGVTLRFSEPPPNGKILYSEMNPPSQEELEQHFSVGAESALEFLLPFKKDHVFEKAQGRRAHQLRWFIKGLDSKKIPLLHYTESALVRVESQDWRALELDEWVWAVAQEAIPTTPWPEEATREAARRELERGGCYIEDL